MSFRGALNEWLSIILKIGIIVVVVIGSIWVGLSIWGNIAEAQSGAPDMPDISKAEYIITLTATGQRFLTDSWESPAEGQYLINGYYELDGSKWRWRETDLLLNEFYFGDIKISRR